jgi:hypothetical protein
MKKTSIYLEIILESLEFSEKPSIPLKVASKSLVIFVKFLVKPPFL